jgi:hypothetical protein
VKVRLPEYQKRRFKSSAKNRICEKIRKTGMLADIYEYIYPQTCQVWSLIY